MGNCNFKTEALEDTTCTLLYLTLIEINKSHFKIHSVLGKGGFGKVSSYLINYIQVWKVERRKFKTLYAMKELSKVKIVNKKSVTSVMNERILLS